MTWFLDVRSQRWKKVEVQSKRSYAESARRSRYQDELDIGAGTKLQGRDIIVGTNFEGATQRRALQGQDIVVGENFEGDGQRRAP